MKKAFELLFWALLGIIIYTLILVCIFCLIIYVIASSAGVVVHFTPLLLLKYFIRFVPESAIFSLIMLLLSYIRRNVRSSELILPYAVFVVLVWVVIMPVCLLNSQDLYMNFSMGIEGLPSDPVSGELFNLPAWSLFIIKRCENLHSIGLSTFRGLDAFTVTGVVQYASFALLLSGIAGFIHLSSWRLWNAFFVMIAFGVGLVLNSFLLDITFMGTISWLSDGWRLWVPVVVNLILYGVCTGTGIFTMVRARRREW